MGTSEADGDCKAEMDDSGCVEDGSPPVKKMCREEVLSEEAQRVQLLDLSDDVLLGIFQYCDAFDLKSLAFSCRRLAALVRDRTLWRRADARSRPVGRCRLKWITGVIGESTTEILLSGYSRDVQGCLGHVVGEKDEQGGWGDIGSDTTEQSADNDDNAGPSNSDANRGEPPYPLHRQHARLHINAHQLPRMSGTPTWSDQYTTVDDEKANSTCAGPQFTVSRRAMQRITLACPALTSLALEYCNINCAKVAISDFPPTLRKLSLRGTKCYNMPTDKTYLFKIQDHLPLLEYLDISECLWLEPASLLPLSKAQNLQTLLMRDCLKMTEFVAYASLAARYGFRRLKILDMRGSPIGDSEVSGLGWVPELEELYLSPPKNLPEEEATHTHSRGEALPTHQELEPWEMEQEPYLASGMDDRPSSPSSEDEVRNQDAVPNLDSEATQQQWIEVTLRPRREGDEDLRIERVGPSQRHDPRHARRLQEAYRLRDDALNTGRLRNGNPEGMWATGHEGGSQVIIINGPSSSRRSQGQGPSNEGRNEEGEPSNQGRREGDGSVPIEANAIQHERRNSSENKDCEGENRSETHRKSGEGGNNSAQEAEGSKIGKPGRNRCEGVDANELRQSNGERRRNYKDDGTGSPKCKRRCIRQVKKTRAKASDNKRKKNDDKNDENDNENRQIDDNEKNENQNESMEDGSVNEIQNNKVTQGDNSCIQNKDDYAQNTNIEQSDIADQNAGISAEEPQPSSSKTRFVKKRIAKKTKTKELDSDDDSSDSSDSPSDSDDDNDEEIETADVKNEHKRNSCTKATQTESKKKSSHESKSNKPGGGKYVTLMRKINNDGTHYVTFKRQNEDNASDIASLKRQPGTDVSCSANIRSQSEELSNFVSFRRQPDPNAAEFINSRPIEVSPASSNNQNSPSKILNFQNDVDSNSSNYVTFKRLNNPDGSTFVTIKRKIDEEGSPSEAKRLSEGESIEGNKDEKVNEEEIIKNDEEKVVIEEDSSINTENNQEDNNNSGERDENSNSVRPIEPVAGPSREPNPDNATEGPTNTKYCLSVITDSIVGRNRDQPESGSSSSDANNANEASKQGVAQNRPKAKKKNKKNTMIMFRRVSPPEHEAFIVPRHIPYHRRGHRIINPVNIHEDNQRPNNGDNNANNVDNVDAEPRHHILYVNVSHQLRAVYRLNRPVLAVRSRTRSLTPIFSAHIEYASLVSDASIRRFGRAEDGNDINFINIGPNGPMPAREISGRPNRSNLRILMASGYRHITDRSLVHLATAAPNLQRIDFTNTGVTDEGVERFKSMRPDVEVIYSKFEDDDEDCV